jgi:hypothetical protein
VASHDPTSRQRGCLEAFRHTVLAALAVALCAAPVAAAHDPHKGRGSAVITPSKGKFLGEGWAQIYSLPLSENPFAGNGNPCLRVGHKVIEAAGGGPCTIKQGTAIMLGFGSSWSNVEYPFPKDEAAQRAVALAADQGLSDIHVTVDEDDAVDIRRPRFEVFSPQRTVQLPEDNILDTPELDLPAQTVTLTAHAWSALVRNLRPGPHIIVAKATWDGETFAVSHDITVVRRSHRADDN